MFLRSNLIVRVHVQQDKVYTVRCKGEKTIAWLLSEVRRSYETDGLGKGEWVVSLFNITRNQVLPLGSPIRKSIAASDRVEAYIVKPPDTEEERENRMLELESRRAERQNDNSTAPGSLQGRSEEENTFYSLLQAFSKLGEKLPPTKASQEAAASKYVNLLRSYFEFDRDGGIGGQASSSRSFRSRDGSEVVEEVAAKGTFSDDESDGCTSPGYRRKLNGSARPTARATKSLTFLEPSIGLVLEPEFMDTFTVVKRCKPNSEAGRYPELRGLVVISVNGHAVDGLGFEETMNLLRQAPRPLEISFGQLLYPA